MYLLARRLVLVAPRFSFCSIAMRPEFGRYHLDETAHTRAYIANQRLRDLTTSIRMLIMLICVQVSNLITPFSEQKQVQMAICHGRITLYSSEGEENGIPNHPRRSNEFMLIGYGYQP